MLFMKFSKHELEEVRKWMHRNARPLDLARWRMHFEDGCADDVYSALSFYQNEDGGFGHALEAASWNPNSSPVETFCATEIIYETGVKGTNRLIEGILKYLDSGRDFNNGKWDALVQSNNDYPHAPWWTYDEKRIEAWGYNPTIALAVFALIYSKPQSLLYKKSR